MTVRVTCRRGLLFTATVLSSILAVGCGGENSMSPPPPATGAPPPAPAAGSKTKGGPISNAAHDSARGGKPQ